MTPAATVAALLMTPVMRACMMFALLRAAARGGRSVAWPAHSVQDGPVLDKRQNRAKSYDQSQSPAGRVHSLGDAGSRPRRGGLILGYGGVASDQIDESVRRLAGVARHRFVTG